MPPKESAVKKLIKIHKDLEKPNPDIVDAKNKVKKLADELDTYQTMFSGVPECDTGDTIP